MKSIFSLIALLIFGHAFICSKAQVDRTEPPSPKPAPKIKIADAKTFELENGLKVFVVEDDKLPRITYNLLLDIDPILEQENKGYVDIAGYLIRTGTTTRTRKEIDDEIGIIGASLSTRSNGIYASTLTRYNDNLLEVLSDITKNANFSEREFDIVRSRVLNVVESEKVRPDAMLQKMSRKVIFGEDHPYGETRTSESLKNITVEMCQNYYDTYFKPNVAYLAIVGDVTKEDIKPKIEKYFGDWEPGNIPEKKYDIPQIPESRTVSIVDRPNAVQSSIHIGYPIDFNVEHELFIQSRVMNTILGGGFFRLNENLREKHGYAWNASSRLVSDPNVGKFIAQTNVRSEVTYDAIKQVLYEMERIVNEEVPEKELERAKNYMLGNFALSLENPETIAIAAINIERYDLPEDFYVNYLKYLEEVTVEDIQHAANEFIHPNNTNIIVVGNADDIADDIKNLSSDKKIQYYDIEGNPIEHRGGPILRRRR